jgi:hypothetical protein
MMLETSWHSEKRSWSGRARLPDPRIVVLEERRSIVVERL